MAMSIYIYNAYTASLKMSITSRTLFRIVSSPIADNGQDLFPTQPSSTSSSCSFRLIRNPQIYDFLSTALRIPKRKACNNPLELNGELRRTPPLELDLPPATANNARPTFRH